MSADTEQADLKASLAKTEDAISRAIQTRSFLIQQAVIKAQNRHGGLRAAARALKIDVGYLLCLKQGTKTNPSDAVLKKLRLK